MKIDGSECGGQFPSLEERKKEFRAAMRQASIADLMAIGMSEEAAAATVDDIAAAPEEQKTVDARIGALGALMNRRLKAQVPDGTSSTSRSASQ